MIRRQVLATLWASLMLAAACLSGCSCAGSLRPLESDEPLTPTLDLSGTWVTEDGDSKEQQVLVVESAGEHEYRVHNVSESGKFKVVYKLSLVQVGSYTFFDVQFQEINQDQTSQNAYGLGVLPIHFIGRIWVDGDTLRLGMLDYEWMKKMSSDGRLTVSFIEQHEDDDDLIFLTAGADDLKKFARQYAEDPEAFSSVSTYHRLPTLAEGRAKVNP